MLERFKWHIKKFISKDSKLLVAVSGGADSIVLSELLLKSKINFSIVHVNYKLRGNDSDNDELFVKTFCLNNGIRFYTKTCDFSRIKKSIQEKARTFRYEYFKKICLKHKYNYLLTAHHLDDNIETVLMNTYREKKIDVFTGMRSLRDNIIRPMLIFSKDEILDFAINNKIKWREDKSNSENKYLRNKIRNILIPKIKVTDPLYRENFKDLIEESKRVKKKRDSYLKKFEEKYFKTIKNGVIESKKIKWKNLNSKSIEFILFRKYGFFKNNEIVKLINAPTGKIITSKTHELASNRDSLLIKKTSNKSTDNFNLKIGFNEKPFNILVEESKESNKPTNQIIFLNKNIKKPLKIRKLEQGDYFYPYGMKGKKKVSKFFKDEKLSIFEKRSKWILTDANNQILWIVGMRVDRRLVKSSGSCLKISI